MSGKFPKLNIKKTILTIIVVTLTTSALYFVVLLLFDNINTLFNITAHTEIVKFKTVSKPISRYNLNNAYIHVVEGFEFKEIQRSFNGSLEINKDVNVELERIANGAIIFSLETESGNSVANLYNKNNSKIYTGNDYMLIEIHKVDSLLNSGVSIVFPLSGIVELGKSVDVEIFDETSPILRSGDISMTGYSDFIGDGQYFEAGSEQLYLGDCLEFEDKEAIGFVAVNDNPALQVSYRIEAEEAVVRKPGPKGKNSGYRISASLYDRFVNDRFFQGLSLIFATLFALNSMFELAQYLKNTFKS
jgi:hypothetical protein